MINGGIDNLGLFQFEAKELAAQIFLNDKPGKILGDQLTARLCEEVGELARAVRRFGCHRIGHPDEKPGTTDEVIDEIGDVLFLTARIAELCDVKLSEAAGKVIIKLEQRMRERQKGCT
ncbi:hypothetical protein H1S01_03230 [Heliobacterium chlorum]|uniref:NTP pyrophosphohydrolase MazG-like domain-containing protein n=1 Tax=Heliobacterium chlorum TaxID=2698 RepID=A0ABR7SYB8_HELCL|nr:MazG nucleotide pyrophosphohydrolase domain-containing protein [Heliobacterium chlorum]MBC9783524.1 hypothetical protein [Heliobacterium chlorum]